MESKNLSIYCITDKQINYLENLKLKIVVGGSFFKKENFPKNWFLDRTKINISKKIIIMVH